MEQLVARRAHNPKAIGSSPIPATKKIKGLQNNSVSLFSFDACSLINLISQPPSDQTHPFDPLSPFSIRSVYTTESTPQKITLASLPSVTNATYIIHRKLFLPENHREHHLHSYDLFDFSSKQSAVSGTAKTITI